MYLNLNKGYFLFFAITFLVIFGKMSFRDQLSRSHFSTRYAIDYYRIKRTLGLLYFLDINDVPRYLDSNWNFYRNPNFIFPQRMGNLFVISTERTSESSKSGHMLGFSQKPLPQFFLSHWNLAPPLSTE